MKVISFHTSSLDRQLMEAVRIRRRGGEGSILNSKAEYSRCHVPRLMIEKEETPPGRAEEVEKNQLLEEEAAWEEGMIKERRQMTQDSSLLISTKRDREGKGRKVIRRWY